MKNQANTGAYQPDITSMLLLVGVGVLIAMMLPLSRAAMDIGMTPLAYAFWQALGGGIVLLVWRRRGSQGRFNGALLRYFGISGLTAIAVPNALAFIVVANIGSGLTSTLYALPSLAIGNVYRTTHWPVGASPEQLAPGMLLGGAVLILLVILASGSAQSLAFSGQDLWVIVVVQSVLTAISYRGFFHLQKRTSPTFLSQLGFVITPAGLLFGIVFFGESYGWAVWGGVVLLMMGVLLANGVGRERQRCDA